MSESLVALGRKIDSASDLKAVVRTMKALAASNVVQFQQSVVALADYYRTVRLGLGVCFGGLDAAGAGADAKEGADGRPGVIVFGSDQGMVGRFNEAVAAHAAAELGDRAKRAEFWAVGERVGAVLADSGFRPAGVFSVPHSVKGIPAVMTKIVAAGESLGGGRAGEVLLFHNRPVTGAGYEPVGERLLPFDAAWLRDLAASPWPSKIVPEVAGDRLAAARALVREYLFVSFFRACAESLASENASRLAAMQRADKNIDEMLADLRQEYSHERQNAIDAELFDVIAGFSGLAGFSAGRAGASSLKEIR